MSATESITFTGEMATFTSAGESAVIRIPCGAAAPLVLNGAAFVGCSLDAGHNGPHEVTVRWER